jgi:hypothetical protein
VEPGIIADPRAFHCVLLEPFGDARLRHRLVAPVLRVDLLAYLQRVAPVDENGGFGWKPVSQARRWA